MSAAGAAQNGGGKPTVGMLRTAARPSSSDLPSPYQNRRPAAFSDAKPRPSANFDACLEEGFPDMTNPHQQAAHSAAAAGFMGSRPTPVGDQAAVGNITNKRYSPSAKGFARQQDQPATMGWGARLGQPADVPSPNRPWSAYPKVSAPSQPQAIPTSAAFSASPHGAEKASTPVCVTPATHNRASLAVQPPPSWPSTQYKSPKRASALATLANQTHAIENDTRVIPSHATEATHSSEGPNARDTTIPPGVTGVASHQSITGHQYRPASAFGPGTGSAGGTHFGHEWDAHALDAKPEWPAGGPGCRL